MGGAIPFCSPIHLFYVCKDSLKSTATAYEHLGGWLFVRLWNS
jgi:hypothetical protein